VSLKFDVGRSSVACTPDTVPLPWRCRRANERALLYTGAPGFSERRERSLQHFVVHRRRHAKFAVMQSRASAIRKLPGFEAINSARPQGAIAAAWFIVIKQ
jgi:hypothetical protein